MSPIPQEGSIKFFRKRDPMSEEAIYAQFLLRDIYIFYTVSMIAALSRIMIRCVITRRLGLEEAIMLFLITCYTGYIASVHLYLKNGTNLMAPKERFITLLHPEEYATRVTGSKAMITSWFLYCTVIWGCKVCIWMVCKRLTDRTSTMKRIVKYTGFFLAFTYGAALLTLITICRPFPHYWKIDPAPAHGYHTLLIVGTLNIISDIPLIAIPIPIILKLQLGWRKKALLFTLFGIGICVVAAAIGRIFDVTTSGLVGASTFWALTETTCAFVVTNIPGIQSVFTYFREQRRNRRVNRRISSSFALHPQRQSRDRNGNPPTEHYRQFSDESLVGSEDDITQSDRVVGVDVETVSKTVTTDLRMVTQPVECELTTEWKDEEDRGGLRVSAYFPGIEETREI